MKLFISVDMEGTTGLERLEEIFRGLPGFDTFRQLMAGDCNAVIQGADRRWRQRNRGQRFPWLHVQHAPG